MLPGVDKFLRDTGMHYEQIDLKEGLAGFLEEMRGGLEGTGSSLLMVPTYITVGDRIPTGREVVVMDAGGTNFRIATVTLTENGPEISRFQKFPMPGTQGVVQVEDFFDIIAEKLTPYLDTSDTVGFGFSFPAEILPDRDGKILLFDKEVAVLGAQGERIGAGINRALHRRGQAPGRFVLLNDSVATMLAGFAVGDGNLYEDHIGFILGTGTNICYLEDCHGITKVPAIAAMEGRMAVNIESGGFTGLRQGVYDLQVDRATVNPGIQIMEKMISGHYQGTVIYHTVVGAVEAGLFSGDFARRFEGVQDISMADVNRFCDHPYGDSPLAVLCGTREDVRVLYDIIGCSLERAAKLTAISLGAVMTRTGLGSDPTRPVCITAEGTTFYKSSLFRSKLDYYIRMFLGDMLDRYCVFHKVENATLIGSGVAALLS